jgi:hypothetical protein
VLGAVPSLIAFFVFIRRPVEGPWPRAAKTAAAAHLTARNALATAVILGLGAAIGGALYIIT